MNRVRAEECPLLFEPKPPRRKAKGDTHCKSFNRKHQTQGYITELGGRGSEKKGQDFFVVFPQGFFFSFCISQFLPISPFTLPRSTKILWKGRPGWNPQQEKKKKSESVECYGPFTPSAFAAPNEHKSKIENHLGRRRPRNREFHPGKNRERREMFGRKGAEGGSGVWVQ